MDLSSAREDNEVMSLRAATKVEDNAIYFIIGEQHFFDNYEDEEGVEVTLKVHYCENMDSSMIEERLEKFLDSCNPGCRGCRLVIPGIGERCHCFDNLEMVFLPLVLLFHLPSLSRASPFPCILFSLEIINFYRIAPMQLTPNSFRMAACTFILYNRTFRLTLSSRELGHFYQHKNTGGESSNLLSDCLEQ